MRAHGADTYTDAVDGYERIALENFIGFGEAFPLFACLTVFDEAVDPWNEGSGEGYTKFAGG